MRIGFLINPIAGMGGRVGLKGTDGLADEAARLGAVPVAPGRAVEALRHLRDSLDDPAAIEWLTCAGTMGADVLRAAGFDAVRVVHATAAIPSRDDTVAAVEAFVAAGAGLVLFCGGDGTARDVASVVGEATPMLGIPAGVKMFSGVFGVTPAGTAEVVRDWLAGTLPLATVDVLDLDEERYRAGELAMRLSCRARTPFEPTRTQTAKALVVESSDAEVKAAIADYLGEEIAARPDTLFLLGPGSTVQAVAEALGLDKTLLGVDALLAGRLIGRDLDESAILALLARNPDARLIVSPIGAQGFVLGRGNLQISPEAIRRIGTGNIVVVATPAKLKRTAALRFDTGDAALDAELAGRGYLPVIVGYRRHRLTPVAG
ncbi:ATP-NAD kinase [Thalassobaculum fulvum]|uniref:ATP-NAD kinase n=1 Tax=Thalassobaculum fulvum TaxID=1633335 RepID=A0A918XUC9_9PROT|nr:ATP-NAD kinase family protein [Thalassobaculum fulvum]GHD55578.1 ATP-NAD kinase [Thalassobaculum fulvum]